MAGARHLRTTVIRAAATLAVLGVLPGTALAAPPALHRAASSGPAAVPGEIVVGFRSGVDGSERAAARSATDVHAKRNLLAHGVQLVKTDAGQTVDAAIKALETRKDVRYAEPNWIYHATATTPTDPLFGSEWGLNDIDAPEAWDQNQGSDSTVVAVVDTGVAYDHPDLAPNMSSGGWDFVDGDNDPWDYNDHGTHVAGTIAAVGNNGIGVAGVAWRASILPVRVLDALGSGTNANIADGFTYAAENGARVVNASLGGSGASQAMSDAITNHPNTLFVVAAGNGGSDGIGDNNDTTPTYPCDYTAANLVCVAATDRNDALAGFSNYGATSVDLAAPGVDVESTKPHSTDSFSDDFESGLGKWTVQSGPWGTQSVIGSTWLVDSPGANYVNNADWAIRTTNPVDVGARTDCVLRFTYGTFLENGFDWLYAESSTNGTNWTNVGQIGDTAGAVRSAVFPAGSGSRYYRFELITDGSNTDDGVYIDNVHIACPGGTYGSSDYQFLSGTSMATPHVSGAATVLFSAKPSATVAQVKAALLSTGDPVAALAGKTVSGRRLNLNAALQAPAMRADTTTTITAHAPEPSVPGQAVTVHYRVARNTPGAGTPTGNVTVSDGVQSCTGTVAAGQCAIAFATPGTRTLTARYGGDAYDAASPASAAVTHHVVPATTTTAITSDDPDPSLVGQPVAVHYTVTGAGGTPTGSVTVSDGADSCSAPVAAGRCTLTFASAGTKSLTATYAGDANFAGSTSAAVTHTVNAPAPPLAHVTNAHQTHRTFRVSGKSRLAAASRKRAPVGTTFSYDLDSAASVRFDFTQPRAGRTAKGKCAAPNRHNKRKPKCTLSRGSLTFAGHQGTNTVRFQGWLAKHKKLTPGKYTLVITALTPGVGETTQRLKFTIVR